MKNQAPPSGPAPYRPSIRGASAPVTKASVPAPSVCRVRCWLCQPPGGAGAEAAAPAGEAVAYGTSVIEIVLTGTGAGTRGARRGAADGRCAPAGGAPPAAGAARACGG